MKETVQAYIKRQKPAQRRICSELRKLILKKFPGIEEEVRMGVPWYGGRYYIVALKDHVNLGFPIKGLSKKELALFDGAGKFMGHVKIFPGKEVDKEKIARLLSIAKKSKCSCPFK